MLRLIDHSRKLEKIPGIGPIPASALVATIGDAKSFENGRQLAAWMGLVPAQSSSGGKTNLLGISKRGDTYLRTLLIHGARSAVQAFQGKPNHSGNPWLQGLLGRRNLNIAAVALANKNAPIVWALLARGHEYEAGFSPAKVSAAARNWFEIDFHSDLPWPIFDAGDKTAIETPATIMNTAQINALNQANALTNNAVVPTYGLSDMKQNSPVLALLLLTAILAVMMSVVVRGLNKEWRTVSWYEQHKNAREAMLGSIECNDTVPNLEIISDCFAAQLADDRARQRIKQ